MVEEGEEIEVFPVDRSKENDKLMTPSSVTAPDDAQFTTPASTDSRSSFFRSILHSNTSNKVDSQSRQSYFSPGSSVGRTPLHSKKRLTVSFRFILKRKSIFSFFGSYIRKKTRKAK